MLESSGEQYAADFPEYTPVSEELFLGAPPLLLALVASLFVVVSVASWIAGQASLRRSLRKAGVTPPPRTEPWSRVVAFQLFWIIAAYAIGKSFDRWGPPLARRLFE
jgi:hypothetical protein